jgi:hypothetical protein
MDGVERAALGAVNGLRPQFDQVSVIRLMWSCRDENGRLRLRQANGLHILNKSPFRAGRGAGTRNKDRTCPVGDPRVGNGFVSLMAYQANATPTSPPEISLAKSELGFQGLLEMSAYSLVRDGATYPAVPLPHGVNDPRGPVWGSTEMAVRLPATTHSDKPVLRRLDFWPAPGLRLKRSVCWTHAVAFREMRIAQILAFVQKAKRVLSSNGVLHTLINRKCG